MPTRPAALAVLALLAAPATASAAPPTLEGRLARAMQQAEQLDPPRRLGVRAAVARAAQRVVPTVVIVGDHASYVEALAAWDGHTRFPVLIDDGTPRAREDIARFVRAFEPERVVRWSAADAAWPAARDAREQRLRRAWAQALGLPDPAAPDEEALAALREGGITPPGLVVTSATDPAWTGALALAAGRCQPLRFIEDPGGVAAGAWDRGACEDLQSTIEQLAEGTGLAWRELGDDLDALTLALDAPLKGEDRDNDNAAFALSDLLGRDGWAGRWAWASQLVGDEPASACRAMCSLFLETHAAWTFDAYADTGDWARYTIEPAASILEDRGVRMSTHDAPRNSLTDWRHAARAPLDADLVLVNTSGRAHDFELSPGVGAPADAPHLDRPVLLHLVHSFSLARGDDRTGVGGRWLERGAYAQLGAIDEPFLQSFIPPRILVGRLASGYPWGAAVRPDQGPVWKLACLGDPLVTLSTAGERTDAQLPLDGAGDLDEAMREHVSAERFEEAVRTLVLLGRDGDAARLAGGLLRDRPRAVTPALALESIAPLYRAGRLDECVRMALGHADAVSDAPIAVDIAWSAARALLARRDAERDAPIALMRQLVRTDQIVTDAVEVGDAIKRATGPGPAADFVESLVGKTGSPRNNRRLREIAADYRAGRR